MSAAEPSLPPDASSALSFPKSVRLRKSVQFKAVYSIRQSAADGLVIVNGRENGLGHARLGLTVSRRVGNAVTRNRWKRCLREAFRQVRTRLPALDLVVTPRAGATPNVAEMMRSLSYLARKVEKRIQSGAPPYEPKRRGKRSAGSTPKQKNAQPSSNSPYPRKSQLENQDSPE